MFDAIKSLLGFSDRSLAVPVFDGPYTPNNLLEEAPVFFERVGLEDMAVDGDGNIFAACGQEVLRIDPEGREAAVAGFEAPVQALALRPGGGLAIAVGGRVVYEGGKEHSKELKDFEGRPLFGVNALQSGGDGKLLISEGSMQLPYAQWSRDLLEHGKTGRVLEHDPLSGSIRIVASGLQYSFGLCSTDAGPLVCETWAHRLVQLGSDSRSVLLEALPGYPARLCTAAGEGYWLSLFAGRTQLMEFILREDDFRNEMMRTVPPKYWFAPSFLAGRDYLEPQQTAGVMQMGIMKPWAPPRSYGLIVRLDDRLHPRYSVHSRAGGRNHGIVAVAEHAGHLYALSKGSGRILRLPIETLESDLNAPSTQL
jgi:sugar lactone lactonase YvrE